MLLTASQVSVAVSSGVVFFFTLALFLSGYALQQRTLRHLREAIKPKPKPPPLIFLPERFKQADRFSRDTTELEDGTVVVVSESSSPEEEGGGGGGGGRREDRLDDGGFDGLSAAGAAVGLSDRQREQRDKLAQEVLSVAGLPGGSVPQDERRNDEEQEGPKQAEERVREPGEDHGETKAPTAPDIAVEAQQEQRSDGTRTKETPQPLIGPPEKPISKAERRRKIREEIRRLALADQPIYYQRRLY